jgi:hypothetical protein
LRRSSASWLRRLTDRVRVFSLEPGKYADIVAIDGDPLKDIAELERVKFVMKRGQVFKHEKSKSRRLDTENELSPRGFERRA